LKCVEGQPTSWVRSHGPLSGPLSEISMKSGMTEAPEGKSHPVSITGTLFCCCDTFSSLERISFQERPWHFLAADIFHKMWRILVLRPETWRMNDCPRCLPTLSQNMENECFGPSHLCCLLTLSRNTKNERLQCFRNDWSVPKIGD
jgi:hypothetical protein